eukprot:scaffold50691_cov60-Phaeocystis_antarctica.AAC.2
MTRCPTRRAPRPSADRARAKSVVSATIRVTTELRTTRVFLAGTAELQRPSTRATSTVSGSANRPRSKFARACGDHLSSTPTCARLSTAHSGAPAHSFVDRTSPRHARGTAIAPRRRLRKALQRQRQAHCQRRRQQQAHHRRDRQPRHSGLGQVSDRLGRPRRGRWRQARGDEVRGAPAAAYATQASNPRAQWLLRGTQASSPRLAEPSGCHVCHTDLQPRTSRAQAGFVLLAHTCEPHLGQALGSPASSGSASRVRTAARTTTSREPTCSWRCVAICMHPSRL